MSNIEAVAPHKTNDEETSEFITDLWNAFDENYKAFKDGKIPMKDEIVYNLLSSPGPEQYNTFSEFLGMFKGEKSYIWSLKEQMYMHDFADVKDGTTEPAILELLQKLYDTDDYYPKEITLVSGLFWGQHIETRAKILRYFKNFHDRGNIVRILTRTKKEDIDYNSIFSDDSQFYMPKRKPFHFVMAGDDYLYFEFPHTESTVFRLNMLLDLNKLAYKDDKSKADMLRFLYSQFDSQYNKAAVK